MEENIYKKAKIVVVDDIEEVLRSTKNCLEFEGMQVKCFSNPIEGLEYLKHNRVDVLLLDYYMPQMNGDEFVKKLREFNNETIVILQTGYSDNIPPLEMIDKLNIQGYLDKLKGEQELILMTKASIKTAYLNRQIVEKDRELSKLQFKASITGDLIAHLVNDAKDQLVQISAMNTLIANDTDKYAVQNKWISDSIDRISKLYNALNLEYINRISSNDLKEIVTILLRPTLIIHNSTIQFEDTEFFMIPNNASDVIYYIIECVGILTEDNTNEISILVEREGNNIKVRIQAKDVKSKDFSRLEQLVDRSSMKIEDNSIEVLL